MELNLPGVVVQEQEEVLVGEEAGVKVWVEELGAVWEEWEEQVPEQVPEENAFVLIAEQGLLIK